MTITAGSSASGATCIHPPACTINNYCSSTPQTCIINQIFDDSCYSTVTGGTIDISISKPLYSGSQFQPCSSSTHDTLFVAYFNISSTYLVLSNPDTNQYYTPASLVDMKGAPFYAIVVIVVGCIMYGVVLIRMRDANDNLVYMKLTKVCASLGLFGSSLTSELAYITALFNDRTYGLKGLAAVVLIARLLYLPCGINVTTKLMGSSTSHYLDLTDKVHLLKNRSVYMPLFIMILLDNTNVAYLPWRSTKFSSLSDGFPDLSLYKRCVYVKIVQSVVVVIIQTVVLGKLQSGGFHSLNLDTQVFLCISITSSIISLIVTVMGIVLQASLLKSLTGDDNRDTIIDVNNPIGQYLSLPLLLFISLIY